MQENSVDEIVWKNEDICNDVSAILFHSIIVSNLAYKVGRELGMDDNKCYELALAGILHDIGKIHLNNKLRLERMLESDKFNVQEISYVHNHSSDSYKILKNMDFSEYILEAVLYHHENYDGTGYPDGLNSLDIPEGARVLRVCDVFAALVDRRIYRAALDIDSAVETMIDEVKNYDMKIFLAFQRVIHEEDMDELFIWITEHNLEEDKNYQKMKNEKKRSILKRKKKKKRKEKNYIKEKKLTECFRQEDKIKKGGNF